MPLPSLRDSTISNYTLLSLRKRIDPTIYTISNDSTISTISHYTLGSLQSPITPYGLYAIPPTGGLEKRRNPTTPYGLYATDPTVSTQQKEMREEKGFESILGRRWATITPPYPG